MMKRLFFNRIISIGVFFIVVSFNYSGAVSNDTSLKSLNIEPRGSGLVQDENSENVYRVKVDNDVTSVKINAVPNNNKARIEIEGNNDLIVGTNKVTINVILDSGEKSTYIIYVRRASKAISSQEIVPNVQENIEEKVSDNIDNSNLEKNNIENNSIQENSNDIMHNVQENTVPSGESSNVAKEEKEIIANESGKNTYVKSENNSINYYNITVIIGIFIIMLLIILCIINRKNKYQEKH